MVYFNFDANLTVLGVRNIALQSDFAFFISYSIIRLALQLMQKSFHCQYAVLVTIVIVITCNLSPFEVGKLPWESNAFKRVRVRKVP